VTNPVFQFDSALVRVPADSVVDGISEAGTAPEYGRLLAEHQAYVTALEAAGVQVETLQPLPAFPDAVFVEDPAFVLEDAAILLRPGAASRAGEPDEIAPTLQRHFEHVAWLTAGYVDGGDILVLPGEILIGLSARTNRLGAEQLAAWLVGIGHHGRIVNTPPALLHLKTGCSLVDEGTVFAVPGLADADLFGGLEVLVTPEGEEGAANLLRINHILLMSAGYPRTAELLNRYVPETVALDTSEIAKLDAGLSCMSLRWNSGRA
jgi:dimethylargininase